MYSIFRRCALFVLCSAIAIPVSAGVVREDKSDSDWEFILAPYIWGQSLSGTAGTSNAPGTVPPPIDIDASFGDILSKLNFAISLHTEFHRGKWAFVIDPTYVALEFDAGTDTGPTANVKGELDFWLVETWGAYKLTGNWELLAGARWQKQDLTITGLPTPAPAAVNLGDDWLDWFAGVRANYPLGEKWIFIGLADYSLAGDSDTNYNVQLMFNRRIKETMLINIGYRYMKTDYDNQPTYFSDLEQNGPVVGYTWAF
jgi:hypothetical protein